jgi:heat shock protein HspQ
MRHFSQKYGIGQHTITRRLSEYDTVYVDGAVKPRLLDNEKNRNLVSRHKQNPKHRPFHQMLAMDEFCKKYDVEEWQLLKRWKCIQKQEVDGVWFISDIRNNLRHCGILKNN